MAAVSSRRRKQGPGGGDVTDDGHGLIPLTIQDQAIQPGEARGETWYERPTGAAQCRFRLHGRLIACLRIVGVVGDDDVTELGQPGEGDDRVVIEDPIELAGASVGGPGSLPDVRGRHRRGRDPGWRARPRR